MSFAWQTSSGAPAAAVALRGGAALRRRTGALAARAPRGELLVLVALAALLNLWALSRNGWANTYYSAAVRSMSTSWHDFLYVSLDRSGVMSVDKPPLSLWVQALSVRVFGYHPLSMLVPQALMGVASVVLVYDLVRRRFGRLGGFIGGLALAVTPVSVAISRHNNPDALLVLCCVAAVWCAVRGLEGGRTRWLVLAGVAVGLGFETKMAVALCVVPAIAAAWLWIAPAGRGRLHALRQLLAGGGALLLVGGAWPALVELTPASGRPWVSGTSDNSILSLIFGYNGLGRVDGQAGGPAGAGSTFFGGSPGPLRLLNQALGGQAGWLLGFALIGALALVLRTRLRRGDERSGWLIAVGGSFLVTAVVFSSASGIFHPYYVSLLAPFTAALTGAGAATLLRPGSRARALGPLAIAAGVAAELAIRARYPGELGWLEPALIGACAPAALALACTQSRRLRHAAVLAALAALLIAPSVWALDTLSRTENGTFPLGGPASVADAAGAPGGGPPRALAAASRSSLPPGALPAGRAAAAPGPALFAAGGGPPPIGARPGGGALLPGGIARATGGSPPAGGGSGPFGQERSIEVALSYIRAHGGGTLAVASQSSAATAIVAEDVQVAGIGGFTGRESDVSVSWLAQQVRSGRIRWVLGDQAARLGPGLPGDTRTGATTALDAVASACTRVALGNAGSSSAPGIGSGGGAGAASAALFDCSGRAAALEAVSTRAAA